MDQATAPGTASRYFIAVTGNCQSMFTASVLRRFPGARTEYFGKQTRFLPFEGVSADAHPEIELEKRLRIFKAKGFTTILAQQAWPVSPLPSESLVQKPDRIVSFPNLELFSLWPEEKYEARHVARMSPERLYEFDRGTLIATEEKSDIKMLDFIDANMREKVLFDSPRHPSVLTMGEMIYRLLSSPALADVFKAPERIKIRVERSRGINTVFHYPASARTLKGIGATWASRRVYTAWTVCAATFREWKETKDPNTRSLARQHIEDFLAVDWPRVDVFARLIRPTALASLATLAEAAGDQGQADALHEEIIAADPTNTTRRHDYYVALYARGDYRRAMRTLDEAAAIDPKNPFVRRSLAKLALEMRMWDVAEYHLLKMLAHAAKPQPIRAMLARVELERAAQRVQLASDYMEKDPSALPIMQRLESDVRRALIRINAVGRPRRAAGPIANAPPPAAAALNPDGQSEAE